MIEINSEPGKTIIIHNIEVPEYKKNSNFDNIICNYFPCNDCNKIQIQMIWQRSGIN